MAQKYGHLANGVAKQVKPCLVCDNPKPCYSWTDYHGEGYCDRCGTPYQLMGGTLKEGESYPRLNLMEKAIPALRSFWTETKMPNGQGTFMLWRDYPDQLEGAKAFGHWLKQNEGRFPELKESTAVAP